VKGKAKQAQLHQDNTVKGVKKLDEGQTVVCYVCHKEGHKSYKCKVKNGGGAKKKEKNKKETSKFSNTYTNKTYIGKRLHIKTNRLFFPHCFSSRAQHISNRHLEHSCQLNMVL